MKTNQFKMFMYFWGLAFGLVGSGFIVMPDLVIEGVNLLSGMMNSTQQIPSQESFFWLPLAGSLMITIAYLSFKAGQDPSNTTAIHGVLISKLMSSLFFCVIAIRTENMLYAIGVVTDFPIFIVILVFFLKIKNQIPYARKV